MYEDAYADQSVFLVAVSFIIFRSQTDSILNCNSCNHCGTTAVTKLVMKFSRETRDSQTVKYVIIITL